jgi:hypothetical protein
MMTYSMGMPHNLASESGGGEEEGGEERGGGGGVVVFKIGSAFMTDPLALYTILGSNAVEMSLSTLCTMLVDFASKSCCVGGIFS